MFEKILAVLQSLFKGQPDTLDVARELDKVASESSERLDWRNSIVDLLKVLKLDSSVAARAKLAEELRLVAPGEYAGTEAQNIQLLEQVMRRVRSNGFKL